MKTFSLLTTNFYNFTTYTRVMKYSVRSLLITIYFLSVLSAKGINPPDFMSFIQHPWVDSVMLQLSPSEKIAQLFIVQAYSRDSDIPSSLMNMVKNQKVGGVIFMQGTAGNQKEITRQLQQNANIPLLIAIDAEWGPAFRLSNTPTYPYQMTLGAISNDSLLYKMGVEIGTQLKELGVHVNFAPVADVNNNPNNPVINYRSFGEDPEKVYRKAWLYAKGMQDVGILAVAKHFPGHGDTGIDSHHALPVINKDQASLWEAEIYPFKKLIEEGIGGIMTAHLQVPALEPDKNIPSSLSPRIIRDILIKELGFTGIIITDAMNMSGVSGQFGSGESAVRALIAGNDMLEIIPNLTEALNAVAEAIQKGRLTQEDIDWKCRKILALKKWLAEARKVTPPQPDKNSYELTRRLLHEQALTLLRNNNNIIPFQALDTLKTAVVSIGNTRTTSFQTMVKRYINADFYHLRENASKEDIDKLIKLLSTYNTLICGIHNLNNSPSSKYGTDSSIDHFLKMTEKKIRIVCLFGNPYVLNYIPNIEKVEGLLVAYQENSITQEAAAQALFGAIETTGRLPVNVNSNFRLNSGEDVKKNFRLKYTIPEEVGISSAWFSRQIDSLALFGLSREAYPGCQILIAVQGKVIYNKCFGYLAYGYKNPVTEETIYDLASMTKVIGTTTALMKLYGEKKINLDIPLSNYWTDFKESDKNRMTMRQMLTHQARLVSFIPFWNVAKLPNGSYDPSIFSNKPSPNAKARVASNMYVSDSFKKNMYDQIRDSKLLTNTRYVYSDLGFIIFPEVISNITGSNFEEYLRNVFFRPIGAMSICFNPYHSYPKWEIAPTEDDRYLRNEQIHGFVHDEAAALLGGVSGNAGLFANANDVAKVMQMYLQKGYYGGVQYIEPASISEFTRVQYPENNNRRGLGFDKPNINNYLYRPENAYPTSGAGDNSFGHSGYTGTFTWADPDKEFIFIFLSNRVYPRRSNNRLQELEIRKNMLQAIYDSIQKGMNY